MSDSDDDSPNLSAATMAALQEFYAEQAAYETAESEANNADTPAMPQEDWQLSQFWYDEATATTLAKEALEIAGVNGSIACVSCPTLYHKVRELKSETCKAVILEYDTRFERFKEDFIFYDYNEPLKIPDKFKQAFDVVIADPPFLNDGCLTNTAVTVRLLAKDKIIVCTGATMAENCEKLFKAHPRTFEPKHSNNLANEFRCYTNYKDSKHLGTYR